MIETFDKNNINSMIYRLLMLYESTENEEYLKRANELENDILRGCYDT